MSARDILPRSTHLGPVVSALLDWQPGEPNSRFRASRAVWLLGCFSFPCWVPLRMDQSQCNIALLPHLCSLQANINGSVPCLVPQEVMGPDAMQSTKCMEHSGGTRVCLPFHFRPPRPSIGFEPGRRAASAAKRGAGEDLKAQKGPTFKRQTDAAWRLRTAPQRKVGRGAIDRDLCTSPSEER